MKKITILTCFLSLMTAAAVISSCSSKRDPGKIYMPDMTYSRAYETYAYRDSTVFTTDINRRGGKFIYFDNKPVQGTIGRNEMFPYTLPNDSNGYRMSAAVKNPITEMNEVELAEAQRIYNINCGICHGPKGAGDGPLAVSGKVAGIANLTGDVYKTMADGTMFHSITYGKGVMGSYSSQVGRKQRWQIIKFIRTLQGVNAGAATATVATADSANNRTTANTDTTTNTR
jgi:mono/diheme cytochrome c family protein